MGARERSFSFDSPEVCLSSIMSSLRSDHESVVNSVNQDTSDCEIGETQSADAKLVMVLRPSSDLGMETGSQTSKTQQRQPEKIEGSQEDTIAPLAPWQTVILVLSLCIGTLLVAIDTTIVSVAIPAISTEFKALDQVGWYGASYLFTVTAFQPAFGSIYRFFDAKWTYLSSVLLFEGTCSFQFLSTSPRIVSFSVILQPSSTK